MTRQEKRGLADLRAMNRKERLRKILAAKTKPRKNEDMEAPALVVGVGPGHLHGVDRWRDAAMPLRTPGCPWRCSLDPS